MEVLAERDRLAGIGLTPPCMGSPATLSPLVQGVGELQRKLSGLVQLFTILVAESIEEERLSHGYFLKHYRNLREHYIPLIKTGQERGAIRKDISAKDLVILLFAIMDGLQIQWLYEPRTIHMAKVFDQFVKLLKPF